MPEDLGVGPLLNYVGAVPLCVIIVWAYMREWIVPGKRMRRVEADRDRWQKAAFDAIGASRDAILPAAEAVHSLITHLPDPGKASEERESP